MEVLVRWSALEGRHVERREDLSSQRSPTLKAFSLQVRRRDNSTEAMRAGAG